MQHIFNAFEQAEGQKSSEYGGTGIGLALTKSLVEAMNGQLSLESEVGRGSHFRCSFQQVPILADDTLGNHTKFSLAEDRRFSSATILIVDDNLMNRDLLSSYLADWEFELLLAENGEEAVALARRYHPDVILMDLKMPVMDGIEASKILRSDPTTASIPIVAVTASFLYHEEGEIRKITDDYLRKPISKMVLTESLSKFIKETEDEPFPGKSVLIVDDNDLNLIVLQEMIEMASNVRVIKSSTGSDAVDLSCRRHQRPDLILMDVIMKGISGFEATRRIRRWEKENGLAPVPIFAISALSDDEMEPEFSQSGMSGKVKKPFESEKILALIARIKSTSAG